MSNTNTNTKQGRVKWFNNKKGFGFITECETNEDIFVHFSEINTPEDVYKSLIEGEYVQYQVGNDSKGKTVAQKLTGICGGPLLCENTEKRIYSTRRDNDEQDRTRQSGGRGSGGRGSGGRGASGRGRQPRSNRYERRSESHTEQPTHDLEQTTQDAEVSE